MPPGSHPASRYAPSPWRPSPRSKAQAPLDAIDRAAAASEDAVQEAPGEVSVEQPEVAAAASREAAADARGGIDVLYGRGDAIAESHEAEENAMVDEPEARAQEVPAVSEPGPPQNLNPVPLAPRRSVAVIAKKTFSSEF